MDIRAVSFRDIVADPRAEFLFAEYAEECSIGELGQINPQCGLYQQMEDSGAMQAFGVYLDGGLVGFATVLTWIVPHYGRKISSTESIFIASAHRSTVSGRDFLSFLESFAKGKGAHDFQCTAPTGSRFERFLEMCGDYRRTNSIHVKAL